MKFDAFISYRRSDGKRVAQRLRQALRDYRLPRALSVEERRLSIYLDTIFERADDDFFEKTIKPALAESRFLIVILTPDLLKQRAGGNWVLREIEFFRALPQGRNILFATASDTWTTAVPPELGAPPFAEIVDLRGYAGFRLGGRHARTRDEVLKFAATLFDVPTERMPELRQEDARQRLARARNLSVALGLVIVAMALLLYYALRERDKFRRELATGHVLTARMNADDGDAATALLWIAAAARLNDESSEEGHVNRIRFAAALQRAPQLIQAQPGNHSGVNFDTSGRRWIAYGGETADIYETAPGPRTVRLAVRDVEYAEFDRAGTMVFTLSGSTVRVWDASTGRPLTPVLEHGIEVVRIDVRPDGRELAASTDEGVHFWSIGAGLPRGAVHRFRIDGASRAAYSPDGTKLMTWDGGEVVSIRDASTAAPIFSLRHPASVIDAVFSADGRRIATGAGDDRGRVWDASTGQLVAATGPVDADATVELSPNGTRLAVIGDEQVRIADADTGSWFTPAFPNLHSGGRAAFAGDGEFVLIRGDGVLRIWETATGRPVAWIVRHGARDFEVNGNFIATAGAHSARLWTFDLAGNALVRSPSGRDEVIAAFSPRVPRFATAGFSNGVVQLWQIDGGRARVVWSVKDEGKFRSLAVSSDGTKILTGAVDGTVSLWVISRTTPLFRVKHGGLVRDLALSPDGTRFATAAWDDTARVWSVGDGRPITPPLAHGARLFSIRFSADGREIITAAENGRVWIRDAATGRARLVLRHEKVSYAELSRDGNYAVTAATAADSSSAVLWDASTGERLRELRHVDNVLNATFSPDGKRVATVSLDRTARVWDVESGTPVTLPFQHADRLWFVRFSPDGRLAVTTCYDGTARVWDTATGLPVTPVLWHRGGVESADFSGDSRWLVTSSGGGDLHLHALAPDARSLDVLDAIARISSQQQLVAGGGTFPLPEEQFERDRVLVGDPLPR